MDKLFTEATLLLYLGVSLLLGGAVMYKLRKNRVRMGKRLACDVLLLVLLELFCFLALSDVMGFSLFSLACLIFYASISAGMLPVDSKAVLITGCDSGIGYALARYLDTLGFDVFAGVLSKDGQGAAALKSSCSQRLSLLQLDVTNSAQIKEAYEEVKAVLRNKGLWGFINNAGVLGYVVDGELLPMKMYKQCMEVNFFGAVEVSKTFIPLLRKAQGRLINICSLGGYIPMPGFSAYAASKAALSMFSGVMRQELSKWGIKVAAVYPGGFRTSIFGSERQWNKQDKDILESIMPETREDFGEDYIFKLKNCYSYMIEACSADFSPVLHDMHHALLAKKPNYMYTPGCKNFLLFAFHYFPLWIYDLVIPRLTVKSKTFQHKSKGL
ncbi:17-beta-hydroxysteroid dehydrogenase type 2 isoform X1 [Microcaecilia unicolor]|uniref:Estradiol 17-beta-dehydrogenase 2 isoform X1 n=1 Tax=Microcaecilia unicolor TaxID=1415580 RepID=A0A6P7Y703_9AMPH|nr:estradiol 17-beta-dehydrogenase 2 isoform X1 [Microcaecilia unicolor]